MYYLIITILLLISVFTLFLGILRNKWVYKRRIEWNEKADKALRFAARNDEKLTYSFIIRCFDAFVSYDKMVLMFWVWDFDKFVKDEEAYNYVNKWFPIDVS